MSKKTQPPAGDSEGLRAHLRRYLAHLSEKHYSPETVESRQRLLGFFIAWCEERGVLRPQEVDKKLLEQYQRKLFHHRKANGEPLCVGSQNLRLVQIRHWFGWMAKTGTLAFSPGAELELPRLEKRLPRGVLSAREAETAVGMPDPDTPLGLRDRAMLETLYSTGIRRSELVGLCLRDVDWERGTVMVRLGKGKKDRMVPIGERALAWVRKYRDEARPELMLGRADEGVLFVSVRGKALKAPSLTALAGDYVRKAGLGGRGACHLFRHTAATLMLENGADIRFIQEMLGHADLSATQIYAQVSIGKLKEVHTRTHPGRLARPGEGAKAEGEEG